MKWSGPLLDERRLNAKNFRSPVRYLTYCFAILKYLLEIHRSRNSKTDSIFDAFQRPGNEWLGSLGFSSMNARHFTWDTEVSLREVEKVSSRGDHIWHISATWAWSRFIRFNRASSVLLILYRSNSYPEETPIIRCVSVTSLYSWEVSLLCTLYRSHSWTHFCP